MGRQDSNTNVKTEASESEKNASDKPGLSLKLKISKTGTGFVADLKDGKDGNASNPLAGNNNLPPNPGNQTQTAAAPKKRAKKNKSNSTESDENPKKAPKKRKTKAEKKAEE